jgi:hypothetical protein
MTVKLELRPDEVAALKARADARGVDIETVLHDLVAQVQDEASPLSEKQKAAIALLDQWREEDETDDPEELERRDAEFEEFKANINRWRAEEGRPPAFR